MRHLIIGSALLMFVALDVIFVQFSETPSAALVFAVLCYFILRLLSGAAGGMATGTAPQDSEGDTLCLGSLLGTLPVGTLGRVAAAALIPISLLLLLAFIPDLDAPMAPGATVQLGSTMVVFWLFISLSLVGALLGFLRPNNGALDAVPLGGAVIIAQSLLSWSKADASRDALQLALYTYIVWVSICLIGAWVGITLRQMSDAHLPKPQSLEPGPSNP